MGTGMSLLHIFIVALIQGITEFLPISSSGHLILLPKLTGLSDQGLAMDVAVHIGTLGAVVLYFWAEVKEAIAGLPRLLTGKADTPGSRLALLLIIATIPVVIAGGAIKLFGWEEALRSTALIGWAMLLFGVLLYFVDQKAPQAKESEEWSIRHAWIMGLWQAVALIPGASRSGMTVTGARALGYSRDGAARIAMLMSIPTIILAGIAESVDVVAQADWTMLADGAIAAVIAFAAALGALALMMHFVTRISFTPYVIYRVILGVGLIGYAYL
jgi:undecaprenyl-diphosphatase